MKRGRFSEEQIIGVLKQHEAGRKVTDLAREISVSEATIYTWKSTRLYLPQRVDDPRLDVFALANFAFPFACPMIGPVSADCPENVHRQSASAKLPAHSHRPRAVDIRVWP